MNSIVYTTKPDKNSLPGFYEPDFIPNINGIKIKKIEGIDIKDAMIFENVLSENDCTELIKFMMSSDNFEEVSVQGMMDKKDEHIGSIRTSIWSPGTAEIIWNKIENKIPNITCFNKTATDWWQENSDLRPDYTPVAVSPLLRFMKYEKGGQHYAHYDAGFIYPDNKFRTLKSMVIYLTTNNGAATRFIKDSQDDKFIWNREHTDWDRPVTDDEIIGKSECIQGNVLIFNHRLCHDVEHYFGDTPRIIIRGDIVYERL